MHMWKILAKPKPEYFALFREFNCKKLNKKKQDK